MSKTQADPTLQFARGSPIPSHPHSPGYSDGISHPPGMCGDRSEAPGLAREVARTESTRDLKPLAICLNCRLCSVYDQLSQEGLPPSLSTYYVLGASSRVTHIVPHGGGA